MDIISVVFYACVCGALGVAGPKLGAVWIRLLIGAGVGVVAATVLPIITGAIGGY